LRALRRVFGPKEEDVAGEWRRLHNEELHGLYASPNIIRVIKSRKIRWTGRVTRIGGMRNAYSIFFRKTEGKRLFERPRRRWEDSIKIDLREMGGKVWTGYVWLRVGTSSGLV